MSNNERAFTKNVHLSNDSKLDNLNNDNEAPEKMGFIGSTGDKTWRTTEKFKSLDFLCSS